MEQKWEFIKHTTPTKLSFTGIHTTGIFITITITSYYINQHVGVFDIDKDDEEKNLYINRMVNIGVSVTKEQFEEVSNFYNDYIPRFMDGTFNRDEIRKFINERNYAEKKNRADWFDDEGRYSLDF